MLERACLPARYFPRGAFLPCKSFIAIRRRHAIRAFGSTRSVPHFLSLLRESMSRAEIGT
jgi:hypothetical protein